MKMIIVLGLALIALPQAAGAEPVMDQVVIGQGGGQMSNGSLVMDLTVGEPVVGRVSNGAMNVDYGYWWKILTVNAGTDGPMAPVAFTLHPSSPNPFSTRTTITYAIPSGASVPVFLGVYDLSGRLVKTLARESKGPGKYSITWSGLDENGSPALAGVYFAKFTAGAFHSTRKLVMLK